MVNQHFLKLNYILHDASTVYPAICPDEVGMYICLTKDTR